MATEKFIKSKFKKRMIAEGNWDAYIGVREKIRKEGCSDYPDGVPKELLGEVAALLFPEGAPPPLEVPLRPSAQHAADKQVERDVKDAKKDAKEADRVEQVSAREREAMRHKSKNKSLSELEADFKPDADYPRLSPELAWAVHFHTAYDELHQNDAPNMAAWVMLLSAIETPKAFRDQISKSLQSSKAEQDNQDRLREMSTDSIRVIEKLVLIASKISEEKITA